MDYSQNFIALDLEMNQPSGNIIQIGIAWGNLNQYLFDMFDLTSTCLDYKKWYTQPGEILNPEITTLTGITQDDIDNLAISHREASYEMSVIINDIDPYRNYIVWGQGDKRVLESEFTELNVDIPGMGHREVDVKSIMQFNNGYNKKNTRLSLRTACNQEKIGFIGEPHRADYDALNTLRLFFHLNEKRMMRENFIESAKFL